MKFVEKAKAPQVPQAQGPHGTQVPYVDVAEGDHAAAATTPAAYATPMLTCSLLTKSKYVLSHIDTLL